VTEDFSGKKWEVGVQTQAEASRNQVSAKVDAAAAREQEDRQRVLSALTEHGGREGITLNKLVPHTRMRRSAVERHLAVLSDSSQAEVCGDYRGGNLWSCTFQKPFISNCQLDQLPGEGGEFSRSATAVQK
jgi:DNA-binding transcriptional ArsR family regulator